jgi:RimJ/RimL family protein N-acetyltransferase
MPLDRLAGLETQRLALRPLSLADVEPFRRLTDDPAIAAAIPFIPHPFARADAEAFLAQRESGRDLFVGVWRRDAGDLAGVVGVHLRGEAEVEIGYWFGSAYHGAGYASEAARAVAMAVRGLFPDRLIYAECRPANRASWRVLEKAGFRPTGADGTRPERRRLELGG